MIQRIVKTKDFDKGVAKLDSKTIQKLKQIIHELCEFKITNQYHNHLLQNTDQVYELHVKPNVLLTYKYFNEEVLEITLKLLDLDNHDKLDRKDYSKVELYENEKELNLENLK